VSESVRANIILLQSSEESISSIEKALNVNRTTIYKFIDKALAMGPDGALHDLPNSPKEFTITEEAELWVVNLA
jgi:hypothetical protein